MLYDYFVISLTMSIICLISFTFSSFLVALVVFITSFTASNYTYIFCNLTEGIFHM